jgi:hypothetical protein
MTHLSLRSVGRTALALAASMALALAVAAPASAAPRSPAVPSGLPSGIEATARYVPTNSCDPTAKPGTVKLAKLLKTTYPNTSYGISRTCGSVPNSEHLEGRAVDWMNSIRKPTQAAQAKVVLSWLMATDKAGHPRANATRLGVMYVIWNNKIWSAYSADRGWRPYNNCANKTKRSSDTACHRDHMHISLSWEGAMGRTSFWSKRVASLDYGPCRAKDLNWAAPYTAANPKRRPPLARPPWLRSIRRRPALRALPQGDREGRRFGHAQNPDDLLRHGVEDRLEGQRRQSRAEGRQGQGRRRLRAQDQGSRAEVAEGSEAGSDRSGHGTHLAGAAQVDEVARTR